MLQPWLEVLSEKIKSLRAAESVSPKLVMTNDPLLPKIADLFGPSVGEPFPEAKVRELVENATNFRYPNRIPPGFADANKETELLAAGDYIAWEQIIEHAMTLDEVRRVIFVSGDTKGDWYELDSNGRPIRPWPALHDEMRRRSDAELLLLTPRQFLRGAQLFLNAPVEPETYEDVDRVALASASQQARASADTGFGNFIDDRSSRDITLSGSEQTNRSLYRRLEKVTQEYDILNAQLNQLRVDNTHVGDFDDPRSFASAIASRVQSLNDEATKLSLDPPTRVRRGRGRIVLILGGFGAG
jgi:hypothetical protein